MVKSLEELKELILWAKEQKISSIKIGDIAFEVSTHAFNEALIASLQEPTKAEVPTEGLSDADKQQKIEDDEDLYWSTRK